MAYCGPRGIPRSTFLGWDLDDQDAALAWQAHEAARCSGCGTHPDEPPHHLHVNVCDGCAEVARVRDGEDMRERGAVLRTTAGQPSDCPRCTGG